MEDAKAKQSYMHEYQRYGLGFIGALVLIYTAYFFVTGGHIHGTTLAIVLLICASLQLLVQLIVFLHLGKAEKGGKLMTWSMAYMFFMVLVLVVCSIWIMDHLNYNMKMTPEQMEKYMIQENNAGF